MPRSAFPPPDPLASTHRPAPATARALGFTDAEWTALCALRQRFRVDGDRFDRRERARLGFARWLYRTGRLREDGDDAQAPGWWERARTATRR